MRLAPILFVAACSSSAPLAQAPQPVPAPKPPEPPAFVATPSSTPDPVCTPPPPRHDDIETGDYPDVERLASSKDACAVADNNLAREEAEILAATAHGAAVPMQPWDAHTTPKFLDVVKRRFDLQPDELAALKRASVVVPARLEVPSYTMGYHEIFQSQLPVYITADSIFHAVFASHDSFVSDLESDELSPALDDAITKMHCALAAAAADYPPEVARDLDVYLTVARKLTGDVRAKSTFADPAIDAESTALVSAITAATELTTVSLFGRPRLVDFTQYRPRGHYAKQPMLQDYFRVAMWASRLEFNLVSRSSRSSSPSAEPDPSETPREALDALALADLATRSGAAPSIATVDRAWQVLAGPREDVSIDQLAALAKQIGSLKDPAAFTKLKAAIGDRFQRTVRLHPMPQGSKVLPAIATLIGPRIVPDAQAIMPLVNGAVPDRNWIGAADVAYTLGFDHAKALLAGELAKYGNLDTQLGVARGIIAKAPVGEDLYTAWFAAVRALATIPDGTKPTFMATTGLDLRMNTLAAAYGQIKHNYVLVAGQPYAEFGCEIPDGYVEPVPAAYDALVDYATRGAKLATFLEDKDATKHFERVAQILHVLRAISADELAGRSLTTAERHWLGMVAELNVNLGVDTTGHPPMYTGWYFDLFRHREEDGMRHADFIADYFTGQEGVAYVGATAPRLGVFVVDSNGAPRAFVGPVARAYDARGPLAQRFTDEAPAPDKLEPWAASYTVAAPPAPASLQVRYDTDAKKLVFTSTTNLGRATIRSVDHHRVPTGATSTVAIKAGTTELAFAHGRKVGGFTLQIGAFRDLVVNDSYGELHGQWGAPVADPDAAP